MFGISFAKILLLVAVVAAVWFGFRWLQQMSAGPARDAKLTRRDGTPSPRAQSRAVEDLIACPACRAYVSADAPTSCGRRDCPYPGAH